MDQGKTNIRYLRVILTNICNLNCMGCHQEGQTCYDEITEFDLIKIITSCIHVGVRKVKLMGGEPTLRNDLSKIIHNIKNIDKSVDLSLISNGTAEIELYNMCFYKGLDRLNISIHGFGLEYFLLNTNSKLFNNK